MRKRNLILHERKIKKLAPLNIRYKRNFHPTAQYSVCFSNTTGYSKYFAIYENRRADFVAVTAHDWDSRSNIVNKAVKVYLDFEKILRLSDTHGRGERAWSLISCDW